MWVRWIGCRYVLPMMMKKRHVNLKFDMRLDNNKVTVHDDTSNELSESIVFDVVEQGRSVVEQGSPVSNVFPIRDYVLLSLEEARQQPPPVTAHNHMELFRQISEVFSSCLSKAAAPAVRGALGGHGSNNSNATRRRKRKAVHKAPGNKDTACKQMRL